MQHRKRHGRCPCLVRESFVTSHGFTFVVPCAMTLGMIGKPMKTVLLAFLITAGPIFASHLGLGTVKQPTYLLGTEADSVIRIIDVPFVTAHADPEWRFTAICQPFVPAADISWKEPHDVNLTSLYGIKVMGTFKNGTRDMDVIIDATKAKVPQHYPFTITQVVDAVATCVKLMYPAKPEEEGKLEIRIIPHKK